MRETWKKITHWPYRVSTLGQVQRITAASGTSAGRTLKPLLLKAGTYFYVVLSDGSRRCNKYIHQLVLETFVGPRPNGMACRHGIRGKRNNFLTNLSWGTYSANNGEDRVRDGTSFRGEQNPQSRLNRQQVLKARSWAGKMTHQKIANKLNISREHARDIVNRKRWAWL